MNGLSLFAFCVTISWQRRYRGSCEIGFKANYVMESIHAKGQTNMLENEMEVGRKNYIL